MDGFAGTFKEAVGRWRRRHRHPPANEQWFAVHYRAGWLVEKLTTLESVYLLRQGLDVRPLAAERPPRKRGKDGQIATVDTDADGPEPDHPAEATDAEEGEPAVSAEPTVPPAADAG